MAAKKKGSSSVSPSLIENPWKDHQPNIRFFIKSTPKFIIYLDHELDVEWVCTDEHSATLDQVLLGKVSNRISMLRSLAPPIIDLHEDFRQAFFHMLAEGMARALEGAYDVADTTLTEAEKYINARSAERTRIWYVLSAFLSSILLSAICTIVGLVGNHLHPNPLFAKTCVAIAAGSVGAFISILLRSNKIPASPAAGAGIHYLESGGRIIAGGISALLVELCIDAGVLLPQVTTLNLLAIVAFFAGTSERFLPTIIEKGEVMLLDKAGSSTPKLGETSAEAQRKPAISDGSKE